MQHLYDLFMREKEDFEQEAAAAEGRFKTKLADNEKKNAEAAAATVAAPSAAAATVAAPSAADVAAASPSRAPGTASASQAAREAHVAKDSPASVSRTPASVRAAEPSNG